MSASLDQQTLVYNVTGQVLEWYPPFAEVMVDGAPAAASVRAFKPTQSDDATDLAIALATATLDTVNTTVSGASGYMQANRSHLLLTSATGVVVGRQYLLESATGQREIVVPAAVKTGGGDYADLEKPLQYDYTTSATFKGLRQTFAIPNAFIQDSNNITAFGNLVLLGTPLGVPFDAQDAPPFRAEWQYTLGGIARRIWSSFIVARKQVKNSLTVQHLRQILPDVALSEWATQRGQDYLPQLIAAEREVEIDTRLAKYDPDSIIDPRLWNQLVLYRWVVVIARGRVGSDGSVPESVARFDQEYRNLFNNAIGVTCKAFRSLGNSGAVTLNPPTAVFLRGR